MDDFEEIYATVTGDRQLSGGVPWVENAFVEGTDFTRAYRDFRIAREHLCRRFNLDWEDEDLERLMDAVLCLSEDLARRMFRYGIEYANRGCKI